VAGSLLLAPAKLIPRAELADTGGVFRLCRYCGDELPRPRRPLEICAKCENSPLCDRCGHPRADHSHVFVRGVDVGCNRRIGDFQTLTSRPCDCEGFRPITGSLSEASFAAPDDDQGAPPPLLRVVTKRQR
jgi:hypothetical protein